MKYLKRFNESIEMVGYNPDENTINIINDITQDLQDDFFNVDVEYTSAPLYRGGKMKKYISEISIKITKQSSYEGILTFEWNDIKDRVAQLISTLNEETDMKYRAGIFASDLGESKFFKSVEELSVYSNRTDVAIPYSELSKLQIKFTR